jgi:hypothetical protein
MADHELIVVQETEYTGAGKHLQAQLTFARENGIDVRFGDPREEICGESIVLPEHPRLIQAEDADLDALRRSYLSNCLSAANAPEIGAAELDFLVAETNGARSLVLSVLDEFGVAH